MRPWKDPGSAGTRDVTGDDMPGRGRLRVMAGVSLNEAAKARGGLIAGGRPGEAARVEASAIEGASALELYDASQKPPVLCRADHTARTAA